MYYLNHIALNKSPQIVITKSALKISKLKLGDHLQMNVQPSGKKGSQVETKN